MIIIQSHKQEADRAESEVSALKAELARLKSKLCPTCGQMMPEGRKAIEHGYSTTDGKRLW